MRKLLLLFILAITSCAVASAHDYVPLLEQGKTWKYNSYGFNPETGNMWTENLAKLELGEQVEVLGVLYYPLYESWYKGMEGKALVAYLREDVDAHKVWALVNDDCDPFTSSLSAQFRGIWADFGLEEYMLYDFDDWKTAFLPYPDFKFEGSYINDFEPGTEPYTQNYGDFEYVGYSVDGCYAIVDGL